MRRAKWRGCCASCPSDVGARSAAARAPVSAASRNSTSPSRAEHCPPRWTRSSPPLHEAGVFVLPQLRHPLLPRDHAVPNDVRLGESHHVLVLSGPNAGGKTVAMKSVALAALCARAGLHVAAGPGARVDWTDATARRHRRRPEPAREPLDLLRAPREPRAHRRGRGRALARRARRDRRRHRSRRRRRARAGGSRGARRRRRARDRRRRTTRC